MARAAAPAAVCGAFDLRLAVCVAGEPAGLIGATFASIRANVLAALGANITVFVSLRTAQAASHHQDVERVATRWLNPARTSVRPLGSHRTGGMAGAGASAGAVCRRIDALMRARRDCLMMVREFEQSHDANFQEVLVLPPDALWIAPLWPFCLHPANTSSLRGRTQLASYNRHFGAVWWLTRRGADLALGADLGPATDDVPAPCPYAVARDGAPSDGAAAKAAEERPLIMLAAQPSSNFTSREDPGLFRSVRVLGASTGHPQTHPQLDCDAWVAIVLALRASSSSSATPLACPPSTDLAAFANDRLHWHRSATLADATGISAGTSAPPRDVEQHQRAEQRAVTAADAPTRERDGKLDSAAVASTTRLVCSAAARATRPLSSGTPPTLALCIGGLARTFASALVQRALVGHLQQPLGMETTLFAHLRLGDARGMTGAFGKDFSATIVASRQHVLSALQEMGALPQNVVVLEQEAAAVQPPDCPGRAGPAYDRPTGQAQGSGGKPSKCTAYGLACSQHVVDGMLATRGALYGLMEQHEARWQMLFEFVLFVRPDVVALLPWLPWCMLPVHAPRKNQDWLEMMPRHLAAGALAKPHDDYYSCRAPNFTLFGRDYAQAAAAYGTSLVQDDSLRLVAIARDKQLALPHKKDCGELAVGFSTVLPGAGPRSPALGLPARLVAQLSPALRHCARCPLDACASLTFANPMNRIIEGPAV